jgi:hypothetical protein
VGVVTAQCPTCKGRGILPDARACALPDCGREFVWQDDGQGRARPRADAIYCSDSCQNVAAQRAYRSRDVA